MACLDTSFLIDLLKGRKEVQELKEELDSKEIILGIASPSITELWTGALISKLPEKEKEKITELINSLTVLTLDEKSAKEAGEIEADLLKEGNRIQTEDTMIAGIAIANNQRVVTRDAHYARIKRLKVLKY